MKNVAHLCYFNIPDGASRSVQRQFADKIPLARAVTESDNFPGYTASPRAPRDAIKSIKERMDLLTCEGEIYSRYSRLAWERRRSSRVAENTRSVSR